MSGAAYFQQECPVCGRHLRVRVAYLGKLVACQHCGGKFRASDPDSGVLPPSDSGMALIERAEQLLETARIRRPRSA